MTVKGNSIPSIQRQFFWEVKSVCLLIQYTGKIQVRITFHKDSENILNIVLESQCFSQ